jgi:transposase
VAGRPTLLTADRADDLVLLLAAGVSSARAARIVGVSERSLRRWLSNGLRDRVQQARAARLESTDALAEARLVVLISRAALADWRAGGLELGCSNVAGRSAGLHDADESELLAALAH